MDTLLLQDWTTIMLASGVVVAQGASGWLDVGNYEDLTFYLDVRQASGGAIHLLYETAPVAQDSAFTTMIPSFLATVGTRVDQVLAAYANVPPARFVRWRASPDAAAQLTFRVWLAGYAPAPPNKVSVCKG